MKKIISLMLAVVMLTSLFISGCSKAKKDTVNGNATTTVATEVKTEELPFVELSYYIGGTPQPDLERVNEELNKLLLEKINAKVTIKLLDWGAYDQKMSVMIAAGEEFDACFTAPWINNYGLNVGKGALVPMDDLLDQYMPKTKALMSEEVWNAARVNGSIYGVINQQIMVRQTAVSMPKAMADKYGFNLSSIKKLKDVEPYLQAVKEKEADTSQIFADYETQSLYPYFGWEDIGGSTSPGVIQSGDTKVFNQYETAAFKEHATMMRDWYEKGYIPEDVLTRDIEDNKTLLRFPGTYKPGGEADEGALFGQEAYLVPIGQPQLTTNNVIATMTGISSTSKNPERTAMFLELMNTDKDVYNLVAYGIEGVHYNKVGDNRIEVIKNSGYYPNISWEMGNVFNAYLLPTQSDDVWTQTKQLNDSTTPSKLMGFSFDVEPVKSELANCSAVVKEYLPALTYGVVPDVEAHIQELNDKLKQAGVEKVMAEKQKQIDAFLASK